MKCTISLAQMAVLRARPEENLRKGEAFVAEAARRKSDIVCFPEMWTTGFLRSGERPDAGSYDKAIAAIAAMGRRYRIWINGSTPSLNDEGRIANTSILFDPAGARAGAYHKTHLFSIHHEDEQVAPGKSLSAAQTPWGLAGLAICYDIRFPEIFRTYALQGAVAVFLSAAFPYPRLAHWKVLMRARAIEDQLFMIGTNRVGSEDLGPAGTVTYFGNSSIIDPWGETVIEAGEKEEGLLTATIDLDRVDEARRTMTVLKDRRPELYNLG